MMASQSNVDSSPVVAQVNYSAPTLNDSTTNYEYPAMTQVAIHNLEPSIIDDHSVSELNSARTTTNGLESLFNGTFNCVICYEDKANKEKCFVDGCTHYFCFACLSSIKPPYACMVCRIAIDGFFTIIQVGELHRIKKCFFSKSSSGSITNEDYHTMSESDSEEISFSILSSESENERVEDSSSQMSTVSE